MCFYNPDVRTAGEPRLAACLEKPETPPQPNQQGKVSYTTLPLHSSYSKHILHRKHLARCVSTCVDISWIMMVSTNICDSSADYQSHNDETVRCHSALGKLYKLMTIIKTHLILVLLCQCQGTHPPGLICLSELSVIFVFHRLTYLLTGFISLSHLRPHIVPFAEGSHSDSLCTKRVGTRGKVRAVHQQIVIANALPFAPAGQIV